MTAPIETDSAVAVDKLMHIGLGWVSVRLDRGQRRGDREKRAVAEVVGLPPLPLAGLLLLRGAVCHECAYSCSYHPWLISKVPDAESDRPCCRWPRSRPAPTR